ncbi:cyclic nucleotide-binding domain-containing protein [Devosia enhydra]|nr:cyclic nucleotide-binding domain-containing protein [Devosia enhydra]
MQLDDVATILGKADFFEICDAEQRRLLAFAAERMRHKPGALIYKVGDTAAGAHVLVSGTVATTADLEGQGDPHVVSKVGTVFGAMALVVAKPRPVTLKSIDYAETLFVPRSAFKKLIDGDPGLAARAASRIREELLSYLGAIAGVRGRIGGA